MTGLPLLLLRGVWGCFRFLGWAALHPIQGITAGLAAAFALLWIGDKALSKIGWRRILEAVGIAVSVLAICRWLTRKPRGSTRTRLTIIAPYAAATTLAAAFYAAATTVRIWIALGLFVPVVWAAALKLDKATSHYRTPISRVFEQWWTGWEETRTLRAATGDPTLNVRRTTSRDGSTRRRITTSHPHRLRHAIDTDNAAAALNHAGHDRIHPGGAHLEPTDRAGVLELVTTDKAPPPPTDPGIIPFDWGQP